MKKDNVDKVKVISFWLESSEEDFQAMMVLFQAKKYSWSLFIGHLMIEKLLKAFYVKNKGTYPPFIHNLLRLAEISDLKISEEIKIELATITAFNINARYDDFQKSFHKQCTHEFTEKWINKMKDLRQWIMKQIKK